MLLDEKSMTDHQNDALANLDAILLSIDWEITDQIMNSFMKEIDRLKQQYRDDKFITIFLLLHEAVGRYIRKKKAGAHPDSIRFLLSVYRSLQRVVRNPAISEEDKKRILLEEVRKLKQIKAKILEQKGISPEELAARRQKQPLPAGRETSPQNTPSGEGSDVSQTMITSLLEKIQSSVLSELSKTIAEEFEVLKKELASEKNF